MEYILKDFFGFSTFRPFQKDIIKRILQGQDCLVVMATGSGKSLCYQLPSLISKKVAVVISPLISLMQDQVMGLKERGIKTEYLSSAQTDGTVASRALRGEFNILYMTPEKALNLPQSFWSSLVCKGVSLLAVDEAHCISEWGHDFRKEYQQLHKLRSLLPNVAFVALTATATQRVRDDIVTSLQLRNAFEVVSTFDRPNIFYGVKYINRSNAFREELAHEVMKDIKSGGSTIIYCTTVKDVEEVTESLVHAGVDARPYHGQMKQMDREVVHRAFARDELQVVVATVAFGMGIDKPDIRRVIHYGCPKSLESYYQESGRCGRDGLPSTCWLYYTRGDFSKADFYTAEARTEARRKAVLDVFQAAQKYCAITTCRRAYILEYFGEKVSLENCGKCDNCTRSEEVHQRDMSEDVHLLLSSVKLCGGHFGLNMPIDVLRGSHSKKVVENAFDQLPLYGLGGSKSANWWKSLGDQLLAGGYLKETKRDVYRLVNLGALGEQYLRVTATQKLPILLTPTQEMIDEESKKGGNVHRALVSGESPDMGSNAQIQGLSELETKLCNCLLKERADLARRNCTAPYAVCSEKTLQSLAKLRPSSRARLLTIDGVNQWLVKKHGDEILAAIQRLSTEFGLSLDNAETPRPVLPGVSNAMKEVKATPAKLEAWRMWQENGICFSEIANLPDRPKPIKEDTVAEYIIDCARLGYNLDWDRFCNETGFTKVAKEVQAGIERAGSRERLKPIKEQLPDHVSYLHIRMYLMMEDMNLSFPNTVCDSSETDLKGEEKEVALHVENSKRVESSLYACQDELKMESTTSSNQEDHVSKPPWMDHVDQSSFSTKQKRAPIWKTNESQMEGLCKRKRNEEENDELVHSQEACQKQMTEEAFMAWLCLHDGVCMDDILSAFPTSKDSLTELLSKLEGDFLIYRKNGIYRVM